MKSNPAAQSLSPGSKRNRWILLGIIALGFGLRVWGISFGLPDISHPDEPEVVNHAVRFGSGDLSPHRFQYGSLFQYALFFLYGLYFFIGRALGSFASVGEFAIRFIDDPGTFYLIGRCLSAVLAASTLWLTYVIGRQVKNRATGLVAALFLACCFQHATHSHYCTVDSPLTFFFTAATAASLALFRIRGARAYAGAGLAVGLAAATKFNGLFALLAFILAHGLGEPGRFTLRSFFCRKFWLGIGFVFIGHGLACPFFYVELPSALREIAALRSLHASSDLNLLFYIKGIVSGFWGIPLGAFCFLGLLLSVLSGRRKLLVIFGTALPVLIFQSLHRFVEAKYIIYIFPLLAVCGATLWVSLAERFRTRWVYFLLPLLLAQPLYLIAGWDLQHSQKSIDTAAREWIEANIPAHTKILLDNVGGNGPRLKNSQKNLQRQYRRARAHGLMKAEQLALHLRRPPAVGYDIVQVDCPDGFRQDDYRRYRLWQDLETVGHPPAYYRRQGFEYIIVTERYFSQMQKGFRLVREYAQGYRGIRIYAVP